MMTIAILTWALGSLLGLSVGTVIERKRTQRRAQKLRKETLEEFALKPVAERERLIKAVLSKYVGDPNRSSYR
jgi:hypothetical protein